MALKVLILEDEQPAVDHITSLLKVYDKSIQILAVFDSVKNVVEWLKVNPPPDLIFMDIQVADGLCFDVFGKVQVLSPVIFITAYQEYAIRAFKVNSIDYLLKPIDLVGLKDALEKHSRLYSSKSEVPVIHPSLIESVRKLIEKPYKNRFVIKVGEHLRSVSSTDILCFYSQEKVTHICTSDNRVLIIDYSLDHIMELIDPEQFFRISRKTIVNRDAITDIVVWSKTRLKIKLSIDLDEPVVVSREKVNPFKEWLEK